jgi:DNA-binding PadR family transcriptional regulator
MAPEHHRRGEASFMANPWRSGGRGGPRRFEKGHLKYLVLRLLAERPRHGYDLLRAFEERFGGHYVPSAGVLYPALQLLEDMGYVEVQAEDGRKVYRVTEAGQRFLSDERELVERAWRSIADWAAAEERDELHELVHQLVALGHILGDRTHRRHVEPHQIPRIRAVVTRAQQEIEAILAERG